MPLAGTGCLVFLISVITLLLLPVGTGSGGLCRAPRLPEAAGQEVKGALGGGVKN